MLLDSSTSRDRLALRTVPSPVHVGHAPAAERVPLLRRAALLLRPQRRYRHPVARQQHIRVLPPLPQRRVRRFVPERLPEVAMLDGEYGQDDLAMGVPCILNETGLEAVIELPLDETEMAQFLQSSQTVRADIARLK